MPTASLLRYLFKHSGMKLVYRREGSPFQAFAKGLSAAYPEIGKLDEAPVVGLSDANFAPAVKCTGERMRSTSGRTFFLYGCLVSWSSKRQSLTASSTMQAELIAGSSASDLAIWFHSFIGAFKFIFGKAQPIPLLMDNLAALSVANHPKHNPATRHICLREFRIRDAHEFGQVRPFFCPGTHNCADHMTKLLDSNVHSRLVYILGMEGKLDPIPLPAYPVKQPSHVMVLPNGPAHELLWTYWKGNEGELPASVRDDWDDAWFKSGVALEITSGLMSSNLGKLSAQGE